MSLKANYNNQQLITIDEFGGIEMLEPSRNDGFTFLDTEVLDRTKFKQKRISNIVNLNGYYYIEIADRKGSYVDKDLTHLTTNLPDSARFTKRTEAISAEIHFLHENYFR